MISEWFEDVRKRYKIGREQPQYWSFPDHGFAYIQIPKVATRSIRRALLATLSEPETDENFAAFEQLHSQHAALSDIRRLTQDHMVFAFVRDPLARLHSAYTNKIVDAERLGRNNIFRCHGMYFGMSFEAFVERVCELDDRYVDRHLRSQAWFLVDQQGLVPSFVGQLETFSADWQRLREHLPKLPEVGHRNRSTGGVDFRGCYSDALLEKVFQRYANDFELFGYPRN